TATEIKPPSDEMARLQKELLEARVRAEVVCERLDKAERRLEGAATLIGCLRARIQELELETDRLEWQSDKSESLRREAEALNETLRDELEAVSLKLSKAHARVSELESTWWHKFKTWFLNSQDAGTRLTAPSRQPA